MRVAIVLEYVQARWWEHAGPWAVALSGALAARGHEVSVFADGAADGGRFDERVTVELRRPHRRSVQADPLGFVSWARARTRAHGGVSLSFSRLWAGDVWMPMGRGAGDEVRRLAALVGRPASLFMQGAPRWWLPLAVLAERRARASAARRPARVLSIGEPVFAGGRTLEAASPRVRAGWLDGVDGSAVRRLLGFARSDVVLVATAVHHADAHFGAFLEALADSDDSVRAVVLGGRPHLVTRAAERAGAADRVVPLGQTDRMDALLAAADGVVAVGGLARGGDGRGGGGERVRGSGRLVAEAVGAGVPVGVAPTAAGVSAVRAAIGRGRGWGVVADEGWTEVLALMSDAAWRARAAEAARADRGRFDLERVVGEVEGELRAAAGRERV